MSDNAAAYTVNPKLDLVFERTIDVPKELVWAAWTNPEHLKKWFTPAPWMTVDCEIDLRLGGIFRTKMRSPEGQEFDSQGCYLEVVENEKLVWTTCLEPGLRPSRRTPDPAGLECSELYFTAVITLQSQNGMTKYTALVMHGDETARTRHEEMGFYDGWGKAFEQLVETTKLMHH